MLILILAGVSYATIVWIGHEMGLAQALPYLFVSSAAATAVASLLFGLGLVIAGVKFAAVEPASVKFFSIAGCSLIASAVFIWIRHRK